jgi:hypothetical protein
MAVFLVNFGAKLFSAFLAVPLVEPFVDSGFVLEFEFVELFHLDEVEALDLDFGEEDGGFGEGVVGTLGCSSWGSYKEMGVHGEWFMSGILDSNNRYINCNYVMKVMRIGMN